MILKLKLTPAIYLVGFMGCGKSTAGRALAEELGWSFFDLDEEVEKHAGQSIASIFEQRGEPEFRRLETEALAQRIASVRTGRPQVVAMGGGAFTIPHNCEQATSHGVTIWLDAPLEVIEARVIDQAKQEETLRPLALDQERFRSLYHARREAYSQADYRIAVGTLAPNEVVAQVLALPLFVP